MRRLTVTIGCLALAVVSQAGPPSAEQVIRDATARAAKEGKNVLVVFHASWCSWCRRFDALLADPRQKNPFLDSYVIAKITVRERESLAKNMNAGWERTMRRLRTSDARDVPYIVILDPKGKVLGSTDAPGQGKLPNNGGYPNTPHEIDRFVALFATTGRAFTPEAQAALRTHLLAQLRQ